MKEVGRVEEFLKDPREARVSREGTVQVQVPKVIPAPTPILVAAAVDGDGGGLAGAGGGDVGDEAIAVSAHTKRVALQKKAAAAMVAAEDYARRFESGDIAVRFLCSYALCFIFCLLELCEVRFLGFSFLFLLLYFFKTEIWLSLWIYCLALNLDITPAFA